MARYTINYLDGNTETVEADSVEYDSDARDYTFGTGRQPLALIPTANVRSVHWQTADPELEAAVSYPFQDGDFTVLGPEVFASADGDVISWRGETYTRHPSRLLGKATA